MTIEELPDYPAIKQINTALWRTGRTRGAAVLVGAGFSRNAERIHDGTPLPPDWIGITRAMQEKLNYAVNETRDPLRVAEELVASLGRNALDSLLRELIPDDQWIPGRLHNKLVALNWVDILTTNWDTLLERAAALNLGQSYDTVRCLEDLATTRAPRVIKLHGSLPANRPFIVSEEDYRTYPAKFAPFVNLVQQVLLENELCLFGFSGDDPNFLKWSGWIRDHLGVSARRIYLIGVLNLRPAQRRLLEQRNISPVDLAPLVEGMEISHKNAVAIEILLDHFRDHQPTAAWEWKSGEAGRYPHAHPVLPPEQLAERFAKVPDEWAEARRSYPGWAVCPREVRDELRRHTYDWLANSKVVESANPLLRGRFAYEATWRIETALLPVTGYENLLVRILDDPSSWENLIERDFVITVLLRSARETRDEESFRRWSSEIESRREQNPEAASFLSYERALWARDGLDFVELQSLVPAIDGKDPLWRLRKASLYAELGEFEAAKSLAKESLAESRNQYLRDRDSIWALSRVAWTRNVARQYRNWNESFEASRDDMDISSLDLRLHETKCEPWDWIRGLDELIAKSLGELEDTSESVDLQFEAGTYRERGNILHFGSWIGQPLFDCFRLSDVIGFPSRTNNAICLSDRMEKADPLGDGETDENFLRILRTIQADGKESLERHFGRLAVAKLEMSRVEFLIKVLSGSLMFGLERLQQREGWPDQYWSRRCAQYAEVLSRLMLCADGDRALKSFNASCSYARDDRWHSAELFDALGHLVERSLSSIPPAKRGGILTQLLNFPLPDEIGLVIHLQAKWPDASYWLKDGVLTQPSETTPFDKRIDELIHFVRIGSPETRAQAANRLIRLQIGGLLHAGQLQLLSDALWIRRSNDTGFPADTHLYPHVFLEIPAPPDVRPRELIKNPSCITGFSHFLTTLANISKRSRMKQEESQLIFCKEEALPFLSSLLSWVPLPVRAPDINSVGRENHSTFQAMGTVIADEILPLFGVDELDRTYADRILERAKTAPSFVQAYPELVRIFPGLERLLTQGILDAMVSPQSNDAWCGFNAIYRWIRGHQRGALQELPRRLVEGLLWVVDTRREPGMLHALVDARHLAESGLFEEADKERLAHTLELIFSETTYEVAKPSTSLTFIRASCVRLACAFKTIGFHSSAINLWLGLLHHDCLPEVRFAGEVDVE